MAEVIAGIVGALSADSPLPHSEWFTGRFPGVASGLCLM
jgi:hypothetical protein